MPWPAHIYWVATPSKGRLAVVGRPRSPGAFAELKAAGIDVLVSLLEPEEAAAVGLAGEAAFCADAGMHFLTVPITDHGTPASIARVEAAIAAIQPLLGAGQGIGAHCYAGLGRSPLMIAALLVANGMTAREAIARVSAGRGRAVPEMASQHQWLSDFERHQNR